MKAEKALQASNLIILNLFLDFALFYFKGSNPVYFFNDCRPQQLMTQGIFSEANPEFDRQVSDTSSVPRVAERQRLSRDLLASECHQPCRVCLDKQDAFRDLI